MSDLLFQNFSTVQSNQQPKPNTVASAATLTLTSFLTFVTGTVQLANITPPTTGLCMVVLVFTNAAPGLFLTTGNLQRALQPVQNVPVIAIYDPVSGEWWVGTLA